MLFSKLKAKSDELLPPPPPFPSMELEEPKAEKQKAKAQKDGIDDLFKEVKNLKLENSKVKKEAPKKTEAKKPAAKIKPVKIRQAKPIKTKLAKKLPQIKIKASAIKPKPSEKKLEFPEEEPKIEELEPIGEPKAEEFEFPEIEEKPLEFESAAAKPKEIQEAEDEIKSAIDKIKERERPSFLQRLFARKEKQEIMEKPSVGDVSAIKSCIENARQALMNFDLDAAKKNYIEIMKIYNKISPEEQAKVYQDVKDLYSERKSAEELKV